ncbi:mRNA decay activator protein ZFP36L2-B [Collichthys lucidus]|uniref:mRNA decay activator protein ZFP36L2-B n=1 Tax=Collichthys lucidus TaxID=240159 RepID=A0A4U5VB02_COLLU|nr:mRNA decay activator protein ZFP36L2-B [Collichthys lucidus]
MFGSELMCVQVRDGVKILSHEEVLLHLLTLAQNSSHSVELHCAALTLVSQLVVQTVNSNPQGASAVACLAQWVALVCSCCSEEQPVEVKLTAAKVLVNCTATVLSSPHLPLGLATTVSLWKSLFKLLQDEDQEVRDSASDFISVPAPLLSTAFLQEPPSLCLSLPMSWHKLPNVAFKDPGRSSMKEGVRQLTWGKEMSTTVLSAFYDMDMLYKQDKSMNMNALHINSILDKKAVGAPVTSPGSGGSFAPGFFRRNSTSNVDAMNNGNKYSMGSYSSLKENTPSSNSSATAIMNKENKFRDRAYSENGDRGVLQQKPGSQINSTRYKTELCRPFEENGSCKYGEKMSVRSRLPRVEELVPPPQRRPAPAANANVQSGEARSARELCGYGHREVLPPQQQLGYTQRDRPKLHHSLSFSGFSTHHGLESPLLDSPTSRTPPPPTTASSCTSASSFYEEVLSPNSVSCINSAFSFPGQNLKALLAPLAVHTPSGYANNHSTGAYYGNMQSSVCPPSPPTYNMSHLQALRRLSESPVFEPPPSPPDSLSDRESYASGSLSSSGSLSGSESPSLDAGRRLPIFSRLSISDD